MEEAFKLTIPPVEENAPALVMPPLEVKTPAKVKAPVLAMKSVPAFPMLVRIFVFASKVPLKVCAPTVSVVWSKVIPPLAARAEEKVAPAPVKVVVLAVPIVPEVVIPSAPTSIAPKPEVMEPAFKAPTVVNPVIVVTLFCVAVVRVPVKLVAETVAKPVT